MDTVVVISHKVKKEPNVTAGDLLEGASSGYDNTSKTDSRSKGKPSEQDGDVDRIVDSHDNEYVLSKSM